MENSKIKSVMAQYPEQDLYVYEDDTVSPLFIPSKTVLFTIVPGVKTLKDIKLGWYLLKNDCFSPVANLDTAKGIVSHYDKNGQPCSISIAKTKACYCSEYFAIGAESMNDGKRNTEVINQAAEKNGVQMPAAGWCLAQGGWHPAVDELREALANRGIINASLEAIGAEPLEAWYLSSSENSCNEVEMVCTVSLNCFCVDKKNTRCPVLCFF